MSVVGLTDEINATVELVKAVLGTSISVPIQPVGRPNEHEPVPAATRDEIEAFPTVQLESELYAHARQLHYRARAEQLGHLRLTDSLVGGA